EKDLKKAVEWFEKAANQGDTLAQLRIGYCYELGQGVEKDPKKAVEWYEKAANQDNASAQAKMGYYYELRQGVEIDLNKAIEWYEKAANQGDAAAQFRIRLCSLGMHPENSLQTQFNHDVQELSSKMRTSVVNKNFVLNNSIALKDFHKLTPI